MKEFNRCLHGDAPVVLSDMIAQGVRVQTCVTSPPYWGGLRDYRQTIIWRKPAAVEPLRLDRPATSHEYLYLLARSEHYYARNPGERWWGHSVWEVSNDRCGQHPAAMPIELARRCIVCSSKPGDLVLDPFFGSGTTGAVAESLGRRWLGIELNEAYIELSRKRTAQAGFEV